MRKIYNIFTLSVLVVMFTFIGCASHDTAKIQAYNQFAIKTAQVGLWNEAIYRWKQIISIAPDNAAAHNNLGVAYEATGNIQEAEAAYQRATELDPDSKYFRINYRRCRLHIRRSGAESSDKAPKDEVQTETIKIRN